MDPLIGYLSDGTLLEDPKEVNHITKKFKWFILYEGHLYNWVFSFPLLNCTTPNEEKESLRRYIKKSVDHTLETEA